MLIFMIDKHILVFGSLTDRYYTYRISRCEQRTVFIPAMARKPPAFSVLFAYTNTASLFFASHFEI
jgi:hypothetical protein